MKTYNVTIDLNSLNYEVEAESEDDAIDMAVEWAGSLTTDDLLCSASAFVDYCDDEETDDE